MPHAPVTESISLRASRVTLAFPTSVAVITYLDRVCVLIAAPNVIGDLALASVEVGGMMHREIEFGQAH